jgi:hypothetical protein
MPPLSLCTTYVWALPRSHGGQQSATSTERTAITAAYLCQREAHCFATATAPGAIPYAS